MLNTDETQKKTEDAILGTYIVLRLVDVIKTAFARNTEEQIGG